MSAPSSRRAAFGAILAAPLASMPAVAIATTPPVAETASPELRRLIAKHDRINAIVSVEDEHGNSNPTRGAMHAAAVARYRVQSFPSHGLPDVLAKAACLARVWSIKDRERALAQGMEANGNWACTDSMSEALAIEMMKLAEGSLCA